MQTHWVFNDCPEGVKEQIRAYWGAKQPRLEKLQKGTPQAVSEEAAEESFPASDAPAWTVATGIGSPSRKGSAAGPASLPQATTRQTTLSQGTRGEHDALLVAMHRLEAALAAAAPGREQAWNARVLKDLGGVQECLAQHVTSAEAPDGLLAEIDLTWPTLVHRVDQLRREHADLLQQAAALRRRVEEYWCVEWTTEVDGRPETADIRQQAARLLGALRDHQAREADLIFETFYTDIGAGD
jgi:nucleotide-binding universal stress UspA family protein